MFVGRVHLHLATKCPRRSGDASHKVMNCGDGPFSPQTIAIWSLVTDRSWESPRKSGLRLAARDYQSPTSPQLTAIGHRRRSELVRPATWRGRVFWCRRGAPQLSCRRDAYGCTSITTPPDVVQLRRLSDTYTRKDSVPTRYPVSIFFHSSSFDSPPMSNDRNSPRSSGWV